MLVRTCHPTKPTRDELQQPSGGQGHRPMAIGDDRATCALWLLGMTLCAMAIGDDKLAKSQSAAHR